MKHPLLVLLSACLLFLSCEQQPPIPSSTQPLFRQLLEQEYSGNQNPPWASRKTISRLQSGGFYSAIDFLPAQYDPFSQEGLEYRDITLSRFDDNANLQWSKPVTTGDFHQVKVLQTLSNDHAILAGEQVEGNGLVSAFTPWAAVVDLSGEIVWEKKLLDFAGSIRACTEAANGDLYFLFDTDYNNNFTQYLFHSTSTGDSIQLIELEYAPVYGARTFEGLCSTDGGGVVLFGDLVVKLTTDLSSEEWSFFDKSQTIDQYAEYMDGYVENGLLYLLGQQTTNQVLTDVVIKSFSSTGEPQPLAQYDRFDVDEPISFVKREAGGWVIMMEREIFDDTGLRRKIHAVGLDRAGEQVFTREINDGEREVNWARGILSLPGEVLVMQTNFLDNGFPWKLRVFRIENL